MTKKNKFLTITTAIIIFLIITLLSFSKITIIRPVSAQTALSLPEINTLTASSTWTQCHFFSPRTYDNASPTTPAQTWNFADATCTEPTIQNFTIGTSTFFLNKTWTYGELFISFLLIIIILFVIFLIIFNFYFEPVFKIRGRQ